MGTEPAEKPLQESQLQEGKEPQEHGKYRKHRALHDKLGSHGGIPAVSVAEGEGGRCAGACEDDQQGGQYYATEAQEHGYAEDYGGDDQTFEHHYQGNGACIALCIIEGKGAAQGYKAEGR